MEREGLVLRMALLLVFAPPNTQTLPDELVEIHSGIVPSTSQVDTVDTEAWFGSGLKLDDLLERMPGIHARRAGDRNAFVGLTMRGLGGQHVGVVVDGLPLRAVTLGPINLTLYSLESVDALDVYRGLGPTRFSSQAGGTVHLRTRIPDTPRFVWTAGYGSQQTRKAAAVASGPMGAWKYRVSTTYDGSEGDYEYYDDRQTLFNDQDDRIRVRENNHSDGAQIRTRFEGPINANSDLRADLGYRFRDQGVAGSTANPLGATDLRDHEVSMRTSWRYDGWDDAEIDVALQGLFLDRLTRDPDNELILQPPRAESQLWSFGIQTIAVWRPIQDLELEVSPTVQTENFHTNDEDFPSRVTVSTGAEIRWDALPWLQIVPAVRFDGQAAQGEFNAGAGPRLGLIATAGPCKLKTSAGGFFRIPTFVERYGDGVATDPNLDLENESGWTFDGGTQCKDTWNELSWDVQATGFVSQVDGLVVLLQNSQRTFRAQNLGSNDISGVETQARLAWRFLEGDIAYTHTRSTDTSGVLGFDGRQTPGVPNHRVDVGAEVGPRWLRARYELATTSSTFLDRENLRPIPTRSIQSAILRSTIDAWDLTASISVRNLADLRAEGGDPGGHLRSGFGF